MKFLNIKEVQEIYKDGRYVNIETDVNINIEEISLIRESVDGTCIIYMSGRDKGIKVIDKKSIDKLFSECKLKKRKLNEGDN